MSDTTDQGSLLNYVTSNFYRLANSDQVDQKSILILIAAIAMMNINDDQAQAAARRLATLAMSKTKVKKEK